jgi:hydrophobe/amphiphile efflux-1 (HAE1) family protein
MSRFFIDRPVFAWVIALLVMLGGGLAIFTLPVAQFPSIAPPSISITAIYPGADAATVTSTVTQPIEQQMKGLDHLEYMSSTGDSSGTSTITLTFAQGTNPDIAQVQVQNKLQLATPVLPQEVQQQGLVVAKATKNILLGFGLYSTDGSHSSADLADMVNAQLLDPLSRITGVGDTILFGAQYAMRIWLDPYKLNNYGLTASDVSAAITAQNAQVASGQLGQLPVSGNQQLNAVVTSQSRLQTPEQFRNIVLKSSQGGATVYLKDVARVEMGQDNYAVSARWNGAPSAGLAIKLAPGSNALNTAKAVKARVNEIAKGFPPDVKVVFPYDTSPFVQKSIEDVVKTLIEAIVLVFVVMFVFLQNWRATLIPTIAVPVVLLGTFGVLAIFGYSINTLTMFAMVLAIGLLVDDAIVVVENVERIMDEEKLSPVEATRKSMDEITGALVGIVLVLSAVFLPMAFFSGSSGVIYRQFAVTIVAAMVLSILVALILTPALCATILKPSKHSYGERRGFFGWFNRTFSTGVDKYHGALQRITGRWIPFSIVYLVIVLAMAVLFLRLPSGFLPDEDQGVAFAIVQLPPGAVASRTEAVAQQVSQYFRTKESEAVEGAFCLTGFSFAGQGQNAALCFIPLKPFSERPGAKNKAQAVVGRAFGALSQIYDGMVFPLTPPAVFELGNATGFDMELEDTANRGQAALLGAMGQLLGMASKDPALVGVRPNALPDQPQLKVDIDQAKATALGLSVADVNATIGTAWGSSYVNDFLDRGRIKHVYVQGDAPFRSQPDDLNSWYVRGASGALAPFSAFASSHWVNGASQLQRYNEIPAIEIQGQTAPGVSSGAGLDKMEALVKKLPPGFQLEWTGLSYEERSAGGAQTYLLFGLSFIVVFLALAALYESWSVPVAVLLVVPLGVIGAVLAVTLRGMSNDVFFQVGLLTTMGLAAKNAILIVEFAELEVRSGKSPLDAALEAARLRLRPILMTSLAFVVGVFPLAISTGVGSGGQNDIGTGVVGGMIGATILAIFFVPLFYVVVRKVAPPKQRKSSPARPADTGAGGI